MQLLIAAYLLGFLAFLITAGGADNQYGRRLVLVAGLGLYVLTFISCLSGIIPSICQLISYQFLQGVGAAFSESVAYNQAFGYWGSFQKMENITR